jgi:hypothetical protein
MLSLQCVQSLAALTLPDRDPQHYLFPFFLSLFFHIHIPFRSRHHTILNHLQNHNLLQSPPGSVQRPSFHLFFSSLSISKVVIYIPASCIRESVSSSNLITS